MANAEDAAFTLRRRFKASRELVFATMLDTEHLRHWWGPKGCTITVARHEARPGGVFHYRMGFEDGSQMWGRFDYHEIEPFRRIAFVNGFADAAGARVKHEAMPGFPLEFLITITLESQGEDTDMLLHVDPVNASAEEVAVFRSFHESMHGGFSGSFDVYEAYLATQAAHEREIILRRLIDAPRELVFDAFTDPRHIDQWWGPRGFKTSTSSKDVRPGGVWRFMMRGPDGTDYPNRIDYEIVERPSRLVYTHGDDSDGPSVHDFHVTITFEDVGGKTALTMRSVFASAEALEIVKNFGAIEGGQQTIDRLVEHLKENA